MANHGMRLTTNDPRKLVLSIDLNGNAEVIGAQRQSEDEDYDTEISNKRVLLEDTIQVIVTNPCIYCKVGGVNYKICF